MRTGELLQRYREPVRNLFFGVCGTGVDVMVYGLCAKSLSTAVLFAYVTNRTWVFQSRRGSGVLREMGAFVACRLAAVGLI